MRSVLIAWELGGNWGHISQHLPVARALRARGARVAFAVSDPSAAAAAQGAEGYVFLQAPAVQVAQSALQQPSNFADILAARGFSEQESLHHSVQGWSEVFRQARADAILVDHAPGALFAARMRGIPALQIATGFTSPPVRSPLPPFRRVGTEELARLPELEARMLEAMNAVAARNGAAKLMRVAELFSGGAALFATFPELDHYGPRAGARYLGPLFEDTRGAAPEWPGGGGPKVFVYLRRAPCVKLVLDVLAERGARLIGVIPGGPAGTSERPVALGKLDPAPDFAITYAGHGAAAALLLRGVPLLMFPNHVEQLLLAQRIVLLGAGIVLPPDAPAADIGRALGALETQRRYGDAARRFAARHRGYRPEQAVREILAALDSRSQPKDRDAA